ncbi:hypothetical protein Tco_1173882 [Tanacetum coccineum]
MAPVALSDSKVNNDKSCSKTCLTNYETLKKLYDDLIFKLYETEFKAATYKRGLATVEDQLVTFRKNEILFSEEITVLKREVGCKNYEISVLKTEFEKVKQEKEGIEFKIQKFDSVSKSLDKLLENQTTDKSKKGLGYHVVPPPHPLIYNAPPKLDLSNSSLEEFQHPEFEGYGPKDSKNVSTGAPIIEDWESDSNDKKKPKSKVEKKTGVSKTVSPTVFKIEFVRPKQQEKPVRKPVKYAEMYSFDHLQYTCKQKRQLNGQREEKPVWNNARRVNHQNSLRITQPNPKGHMVPRKILTRPKAVVNAVKMNRVNAVKASACWVWRPIKPNSASITLKRYEYVDARGSPRRRNYQEESFTHKEEMAPMALSDSKVNNDKSCSKTCLTNYETLKKPYDDLIFKLHETEFKATTYKRGLATVEAQLITYRKNEVLFSEEVAVLKREVACKNYEINVLKSELEKVKQEKDGIEI